MLKRNNWDETPCIAELDRLREGIEEEDVNFLAFNESERRRTTMLLKEAEANLQMDEGSELYETSSEDEEVRMQLLTTKAEAEKAERAKLSEEAIKLKLEIAE